MYVVLKLGKVNSLETFPPTTTPSSKWIMLSLEKAIAVWYKEERWKPYLWNTHPPFSPQSLCCAEPIWGYHFAPLGQQLPGLVNSSCRLLASVSWENAFSGSALSLGHFLGWFLHPMSRWHLLKARQYLGLLVGWCKMGGFYLWEFSKIKETKLTGQTLSICKNHPNISSNNPKL